PLASPGIIGVSAGGGLAAMLIMIVLPQFYHLLVPGAFLGALGATLAIYILAWERGLRPMRLILAGVAVSSLLGAFINVLLISYPDRVAGVLDFMVGSLTARSWKHVQTVWPYAIAGLAGAVLMSRRLNILMLGDEAATSLGLNVERSRMILIAISSLMAAAAVSVVGLLGFVGLIVPHMMRIFVGPDYRLLIPACALFSTGLLTNCDTLGRMLRDPQELPVGIIMAVLGSPFFLYLLRGRMKHETRN
ncbi:MAG: ferrichrome ABC transporter, partial [Lentisphaerae bacterium GWF2_52_8]